MTKNTLLNTAVIICKILQAAYILLFAVLTILFIHIQIDKAFYENKIVTIDKSDISYVSSKKIDTGNTDNLTLDKMTSTSLYMTYLKYAVLLILLFLSVLEFEKIVKSVKNLKTFRNDNVRSFSRIGQYVFIYFVLSSFYFYQFNAAGFSGFSISLTPLIIMLLSFIMSEIFKEGNLLMEDRELTI